MYNKSGNILKLSLILMFFPVFKETAIPKWNKKDIKLINVKTPAIAPYKLKPYKKIKYPGLKEPSGLVKSRKYRGVYWVHNDSGNPARIYSITSKGKIISPGKRKKYMGVNIIGSANIDWEDITTDNNGNLIIADSGNNLNNRKNLCLYIIKEPNPFKSQTVKIIKKIPFYYPEQANSSLKNFDAEAIFHAQGKIYILTKHRSDRNTSLYRFDYLNPKKKNTLTLISRLTINGQVTGADASYRGDRLAVLTYNAVWLFCAEKSNGFFKGKIFWLPILAGQCEGICFSGKNLMIINENRELFRVKIKILIRVQ